MTVQQTSTSNDDGEDLNRLNPTFERPQHLLHGYETVSRTRSYSFGAFNVSMEDTISKVKRQKLDGVEHRGLRSKSSLLDVPVEE